jgi:1,4-alpha-glucan branching enzyme
VKRRANAKDSKEKKATAVCLEFHCEKARTVCIAGTFNDWSPENATMRDTGAGRWLKELSLAPGQYEYQYVVDGKWINDPRAVKSTANAYGGRNSVLVVEKNNSVQPAKSDSRGEIESMSLKRKVRTLMRDKRLNGHGIASRNQKSPERKTNK